MTSQSVNNKYYEDQMIEMEKELREKTKLIEGLKEKIRIEADKAATLSVEEKVTSVQREILKQQVQSLAAAVENSGNETFKTLEEIHQEAWSKIVALNDINKKRLSQLKDNAEDRNKCLVEEYNCKQLKFEIEERKARVEALELFLKSEKAKATQFNDLKKLQFN